MKTALISVDVRTSNITAEIKKPLFKIAEEVDLVVATRDSRTARPPTALHADHVVTRNEDSFSAFVGGTLRPKRTLAQILKDESIERVIIGGIGSAVKWTAFDAAASGYLTLVGLDIIDIPDEEETLSAWQRAGVVVSRVA